MTVSFSIPVKDHFLYSEGDKNPYYPNISVVNARTASFHNEEYQTVIKTPILARHRYENGMIYYKTDIGQIEQCFSFDVNPSILPYVSVHVFRFFDDRLWLNGPVNIHFNGPEELGLLLKLEY